MVHSETIYDSMGTPTAVNAAGAKTRIRGSIMRPKVAEAMGDAAEVCVQESALQAHASDQITDVTDAEAGFVTSGAAAASPMTTAACIAKDDIGAINDLPDATEIEPKSSSLDLTVRRTIELSELPGDGIIEVGANDRAAGSGSTSNTPWEIFDSVVETTVAIAYVPSPHTDLRL